jgi:hypothetical protein
MANKKINELVTRTPSLSDLILVGDPSSGYSYKATVTALATIIETDIADGFVTLSTTQTISGAKTFSNNLTLTSVANAATTQTKFLTLNGSNVVNYRTGAEVLADIGGQAALTNPITGTGTTNYLPKFTGSTTIGNSQLIDNGTTVFLGTSGTLPNVKMIISTTSQRALELNSTSGNALFVSSGGAFVMTVTNGTWSSQFTQAGRLELGGDLSITTIANATVDTDKFLVSDSGVLKYRTGAEVLSDIGGASSASISGTTNYIPKFTSSSAIGNSAIYNSGANVSINTTTPATNYPLTIRSTSGDYTKILDWGTDIGGSWGNLTINTSSPYQTILTSGAWQFNIGASEQMRLTSTGLGIGTSSPASYDAGANKLVVAQSGSGGITIATGSSNIGAVYFADGTSGTETYRGFIQYRHSSDQFEFGTSASLKMTLDASGNLGIGTSSPSYLLDINSSADTYSQIRTSTIDADVLLGFSNTGDANNGWGIGRRNTGEFWIANYTGNFLGGTRTVPFMISTAGNVGIGTTSPSHPLTIQANSSANAAAFYGRSSDNTSSLDFFQNNGTTRIMEIGVSPSAAEFYYDANSPMIFYTNATERMRITSTGEVYIAGTTDQGAYNLQVNGTGVWGAGAYVNGSDIALKQNILPLDNSLELVKKMKPVTYTYKESYSTDDSIQTGFIAQDLQELLKDKNYLNGIVKQGPEYLNVAYQNLIPLLVKAIQEQQIEIENLKNK